MEVQIIKYLTIIIHLYIQGVYIVQDVMMNIETDKIKYKICKTFVNISASCEHIINSDKK